MTPHGSFFRWSPAGDRWLVAGSLLATALMFAVYAAVLHPWLMNWGATPQEQAMPLPGDELNPNPATQFTRALTIQAPPAAVWPWLLQIGQDRSGFYSYTWLENMALASMPEVHQIRPEWQHRALGDKVPMAKVANYGGLVTDEPLTTVDILDENKTIGHVTGIWNLIPADGNATRLLLRERDGSATAPPSPAMRAVVWLIWDPMHAVMEKRVMLGIQALAEGREPTPPALTAVARLGWVAGAVGLGALFFLRRRWLPALIAPCLVALLPLLLTGDSSAALAAFLAVGIPIIGALAFGRRWWAPFVALWGVVMLILLLAPDAYVVFGFIFGAMTFAGIGLWRMWLRMAESRRTTAALRVTH